MQPESSCTIPELLLIYNQIQNRQIQTREVVRVLLLEETVFVAWYCVERHAIMGAVQMNRVGLPIFHPTTYRFET